MITAKLLISAAFAAGLGLALPASANTPLSAAPTTLAKAAALQLKLTRRGADDGAGHKDNDRRHGGEGAGHARNGADDGAGHDANEKRHGGEGAGHG